MAHRVFLRNWSPLGHHYIDVSPPVLNKHSGTMLLICAALVPLHTLTTSLGLHHLHASDLLIGMTGRARHKLDMASNVGDACGLQVSSSSSSSSRRSSRAVPQAGQAMATSAVSRTKPTPSRSAAPATEAQAEAASRAAAALLAEEKEAAAAAQQAKLQAASKGSAEAAQAGALGNWLWVHSL